MIRVALITVSDRSAHGERKDLSGDIIREMLEKIEAEVVWYKIVPDELETIKLTLQEAIDKWEADLVLTTGGTGLAVRDVTPEATREVIEKIVPGISEAMRLESFKKTPRAILSRAIAGTRGRSLIINLPGSPRGVRESLGVILEALPHGIAILKGEDTD
ncbi:MAG: MogA/MoaB family molybdenum cofactor biosynthesis protein [Candidatus Atribacteria bacterium]|nr:MogA/MoaB family molybdenum cofactor biosynthesis protein [Candidatus Atribacteria bacterium]